MLQVWPFHRSARLPALEFPAAVHADVDVQDTPFSSPPPWGGLGVPWMAQRVPFHCSARVLALGVKGLEAPAAMHVVVDVQATPLRKPLPWGGFGVAWIDHRVPFHRSASGPAPELPTAVHADAEVQDTPFRPPPWDRLGVGWIRHRMPSHRSARAWEAPPMMACPTAVHADGVLQATPNRALIVALAGLGVGRMRHEVPFHRSASATPAPEALVYPPTAMHELAAGQDTQKSWPVGITGFGLGVTDQPGAEAPAGTEARAGETVSSPPSVPSSAPSATIMLRSFDCFIGRSFPLELDRRRTVAHRFLGLRACLAVLLRQGLARPPPPLRRGASNHASQTPTMPQAHAAGGTGDP